MTQHHTKRYRSLIARRDAKRCYTKHWNTQVVASYTDNHETHKYVLVVDVKDRA